MGPPPTSQASNNTPNYNNNNYNNTFSTMKQQQQQYQFDRDTVIWTHFETVEIHSDPSSSSNRTVQKLLYLILAYQNGFQVFDVTEPKHIQEVVSVCGAPVRYATILTPPPVTLSSINTHCNINSNQNNNNNNTNKNTNTNTNENYKYEQEQQQQALENEINNNNNNNNSLPPSSSSFIHSVDHPLMAIV